MPTIDLPTSVITYQSLVAVSESCLYNTRCVSDIRQRTYWGNWCKHIYTFSAGLLQRCTSRNSWHCDKTVLRLQLIQNTAARLLSGTTLLDHITLIALASGVAENRFQEHNRGPHISRPINSAYQLKISECRPRLQASTWYLLAKSRILQTVGLHAKAYMYAMGRQCGTICHLLCMTDWQ